MNYQEARDFLDSLQFFKIKLGLDSMAGFLDSVGNPQDNLRFVHVAGTNGKGSVSITLLTILARAGYRVGLYTSPHLSSVRERFRINDQFISRLEFAEQASRVCEALAERHITYFEFTTALAMLWFAGQKVDLVILEVGMGGRLDATNIVHPLVSVITNVTMDHEAYLGDTLSQVAKEKAGVIKSGVPVVSGVDGDVSRTVVERACRLRGSPLYLLGREFSIDVESNGKWCYHPVEKGGAILNDLSCRLLGEHQKDNAALSLAVVELLRRRGFVVPIEFCRQGLAEVRWPARLEYFCLSLDGTKENDGFGKQVSCGGEPSATGEPRYHFLIDGAHNSAGVESLAKTLAKEFGGFDLILVWGSMVDKDASAGIAKLAPLCREIIFTRPAGERSAEAEALVRDLPVEFRSRARCENTVTLALWQAIELAGETGLVCIAGSLYLAGEARTFLLGELVDHG